MQEIMLILYVSDQNASKEFYSHVLLMQPHMDVPGMSEFTLKNGVMIGLMPNDGAAKLIGNKLPHPKEGQGIPRSEIYLMLDNAQSYIDRALEVGGKLLSPIQDRSWGDTAGYVSDPDGHVLAFAEARS